MNITTRRDAETYLTHAIEAGDATTHEYDLEAILDEIGWTNIHTTDNDTFWTTIAKHATS